LVALDHDRLDLDRRAVQAAPEHRALSRAPAHSERAALLDDALLEAEGQVARQDVERASKSRVLAGGVGEHATRRRRALELEVGTLPTAAPAPRPAEGRRHPLGRLLAELPADLRLAALEERRGVGAGRTLYLARLEHALHHLEEGRTRPRRGRRRASREPGE